MLDKASRFARRELMIAKHHATEAYRHGRTLVSKVDHGFHIAKMLLSALVPMLKDAGIHQRTKRH